MNEKLTVGQQVEVTTLPYAGRTGTITRSSDCGEYHSVRLTFMTGQREMVFEARELKAKD